MPEITKIAITGGPCAGKTSALDSIRSAFSHMGYKVITIPEPATELISNGVTPWECSSAEEYQRCQMEIQLTREAMYLRAAQGMKDEKILMVCDRGMLDNKCYMTADEFARVIADLGRTEVELRDSYDAVFHLVSAAKGAEEFYGTESNGVRYESLEEAAALDDKFIQAWAGHPHLRIIGNETDFEDKLRRLNREIAYFLGDLIPYQIERKFLVEFPDVAWLESLPMCSKVSIVQQYLRSDGSHEIRIRRRGSEKGTAYSFTEKLLDGTRKHLVRRRHLSQGEYKMLSLQADPSRRVIKKTRYCLPYEGQYLEIDLFPCWNDQAICEIELSSEDAVVAFPPELHVLREVTGDPNYRNAVLAARPVGATH